jgi:RimJ/RimL family protein N-acetyltransferase
MNIQSLHTGELTLFAPIDMEKDPAVEVKWMQDDHYLRMMSLQPARPLSEFQMKKQLEKVEKSQAEDHNYFHFSIHTREEDRLIGFASINWVEWSHSAGWVRIGIGDRQDRRRGYGWDALNVLLRFAFLEINLHRLAAFIPEYNPPALALFEKAGFVQEVCRRQALYRDGRRWNAYHYGLLQREWVARVNG